jgi:endonuclease/exonuclease/phosphatase family metal-dependent hydrolase
MKRYDVNGTAALFLSASALFLALSGGCEIAGGEEKAAEQSDSIVIMTWNAQALFDGTETGTEYDEYRESAGWSTEKYAGRLNAMAKAIGGMERGPDIIAIQEVESADVLKDLAAGLSAQGYGWTHFAALPGMALGLGLLSRFPLTGTKAHAVTIDGDAAPRPVLEAIITPNSGEDGGGAIVLFVCHWKSKLGGDDATEAARRASARIILRRIRELAEAEPELPVIIMGDLNENHDEFYRRGGAVISALLPDDPRSAELAGFYHMTEAQSGTASDELQKDFIVLGKSKPPAARYFPNQVLTLYSPWFGGLENGSYYYKNAWETIDHFLLTAQLFDGTGWEFENCMVIDTAPFATATGHPAAYNPRTGAGLSDHLPLLLFLKMTRIHAMK